MTSVGEARKKADEEEQKFREADAIRFLIQAQILGAQTRNSPKELKAELFHVDEAGWTILHACAYSGEKEALEHLLFLDSYITPQYTLLFARTTDGSTCLAKAANRGDFEMFEVLLKAGGRKLLYMIDNLGRSCLHAACEKGQLEIVELLLKEGGTLLLLSADLEGNTCLHLASQQDHEPLVSLLAKAGGEELLTVQNAEGNTCIHVAARAGHEHVVESLLNKSRDFFLKSKNKMGQTVLHTAAIGGSAGTLAFLRRNGFSDLLGLRTGNRDSSVARGAGDTVMHLAVREGNLNLVKMLVDPTAHPAANVKSESKQAAYARIHAEIDSLLHAQNEDGYSGTTCLHIACHKGDVRMASTLLRFCDKRLILKRNLKKCSCLHISASHGSAELCMLLLRYGGRELLFLPDEWGETALHRAAEYGRHDVAILLAWAGGRILLSATNQKGETCLDVASRAGWKDLENKLQLAGAFHSSDIHAWVSIQQGPGEQHELLVQQNPFEAQHPHHGRIQSSDLSVLLGTAKREGFLKLGIRLDRFRSPSREVLDLLNDFEELSLAVTVFTFKVDELQQLLDTEPGTGEVKASPEEVEQARKLGVTVEGLKALGIEVGPDHSKKERAEEEIVCTLKASFLTPSTTKAILQYLREEGVPHLKWSGHLMLKTEEIFVENYGPCIDADLKQVNDSIPRVSLRQEFLSSESCTLLFDCESVSSLQVQQDEKYRLASGLLTCRDFQELLHQADESERLTSVGCSSAVLLRISPKRLQSIMTANN